MAGYTPNIPGATHPNAGDAGALPGLRPSNVGSLGSSFAPETYVRTLYDFNPYAIMRAVRERHGKVISDFRFILRSFGMTRGVDAPTTGHYERDWHKQAIKLGTTIIPSAGAGTSVVVALHADSMFPGGMTANGSTVRSSDIEVADVIQFYDGTQGRVASKDTTTNPHRITIAPQLAANEIPAITDGDVYAIVTNSFAEGTGLPKSHFPRISRFVNEFHIVKASCGTTGSNLTNQLFVKFEYAEDGSIYGVLNHDMMALFEERSNGAVLFGTETDNINTFVTDLEIDAPVKTTQGMLDWATMFGHTQEYSINSYSLADFDAIARTMTQERVADRTFFTLDGFEIFVETENLLKDELKENVTPFLMKELSKIQNVPAEDWQPFESSDFDFYVGFKGIKKSGYNFAFKQMHEFSDVQGVGAEGYNYKHWRVCVPLGTERQNLKNGQYGFAWGYEYKELNGYSREVVFDTVAGIGVAGTNGFTNVRASHGNDYIQSGIVGEIAFHGACPNQSYIQKPAS